MGDIVTGFAHIATLHYLIVIVVGCAIGIAAGATPGMSSASAVALLVPFTFTMDAIGSLALLGAVYTGAQYGGSISATLMNTPGSPESAVIAFDGYPLAQQGLAGKALTALTFAGLVGGLLGTLVLVSAVVPLANEALRFGPIEMFALAVFGVTVVGSISTGGFARGLLCAVLGMLLTTIGQDPITATDRYTFGAPALLGGLPFIPAIIGLFAVSEIFALMAKRNEVAQLTTTKITRQYPGDLREAGTWLRFMVVGAGVGLFVAVHPGGGATVASLIAYSVARQLSKNPKMFGKGAIEGVITPESADKATVGGALIPLLGLGVPGSATTAVLIGAFTLHGIEPGPMIFKNHADIVYALFASLFVANFVVFGLGFLGVPVFARVTLIPRKLLIGGICALCFVGAFANGGNMLAVYTALGFGFLGFALKAAKLPVPPVVLGLVLGPLLETNLRQSLIITGGAWLPFVTSPIALALYALGIASVAGPWITNRVRLTRPFTTLLPEEFPV